MHPNSISSAQSFKGSLNQTQNKPRSSASDGIVTSKFAGSTQPQNSPRAEQSPSSSAKGRSLKTRVYRGVKRNASKINSKAKAMGRKVFASLKEAGVTLNAKKKTLEKKLSGSAKSTKASLKKKLPEERKQFPLKSTSPRNRSASDITPEQEKRIQEEWKAALREAMNKKAS